MSHAQIYINQTFFYCSNNNYEHQIANSHDKHVWDFKMFLCEWLCVCVCQSGAHCSSCTAAFISTHVSPPLSVFTLANVGVLKQGSGWLTWQHKLSVWHMKYSRGHKHWKRARPESFTSYRLEPQTSFYTGTFSWGSRSALAHIYLIWNKVHYLLIPFLNIFFHISVFTTTFTRTDSCSRSDDDLLLLLLLYFFRMTAVTDDWFNFWQK